MKFLLRLLHAVLGYFLSWTNPPQNTNQFNLFPNSKVPFQQAPVPVPIPNPIIVESTIPTIRKTISHANTFLPPPVPAPALIPMFSDQPSAKIQGINVNDDQVLGSKTCALRCTIPLKLDFVCATNGVTYYNNDELRCAKRLCFPDLKLAHIGKCEENSKNLAGTLTATNSQDGSLLSPNGEVELGNTDGEINFGRDDDTTRLYSYDDLEIDIKAFDYPGIDMNNRASFPRIHPNDAVVMTDPVQIKPGRKGKNKNKGRKNGKGGSGKRISDCDEDQCSCPYQLLQVCGTDGRTYGNQCILECMQACDPDLKKYHDGICRVVISADWEGIISPRNL